MSVFLSIKELVFFLCIFHKCIMHHTKEKFSYSKEWKLAKPKGKKKKAKTFEVRNKFNITM